MEWGLLLGNVTLFCDKYDVEIIDMEDAYYDGISPRRGSHNIKDSFYFHVNNLHHYHVDVFKVVIDMKLQELNHRFKEVNMKLLFCIPHGSFKAFDLDKLTEIATLYR
uniref:Uncharacterized protein n=1 Tax=Lactuca sativa TaxID=4236 RepID=A0A9R1WUR3_LACSA|nr:hypothetical protein LSAT_V11C900477940 [Lactuca sativa]